MKKYIPFISLLLLLAACHKTKQIGIDGALYADFNFKPGSYWIYQDSVSGAVDSMYVDHTTTYWHESGSCVPVKNAPQIEVATITIKRAGSNSNDSEIWSFQMTENKLSAAFSNSNDVVAGRMGQIHLFSYPIQPGITGSGNGCVVTPDSGFISNMGTFTAGSGGSYENVAQSAHGVQHPSTGLSYNDCFYTSPTIGFVRLVFNHPADSVYRVLNLLRYKTVR